MIHQALHDRTSGKHFVFILGILFLLLTAPGAWAQTENGQSFQAVATDAEGLQTELENVIFYYEEKVSETSFIPHELRELPVKRGTSTVKIKFDSMKQIDMQPSQNGSPSKAKVTLKDGKTGDFSLAVPGSFKGQSAFGEVELPASQLSRVVFK